MSKKYRHVMGLLLIVILVSLIGCSKGEESVEKSSSNSVEKKEDKEVNGETQEGKEVTLSILWPANFSVPGVQDNPIADVIREKTGVTMDIISEDGNKTKQKLALAAGDLPDIVMSNVDMLTQIVEGGHALALNQYLNKELVNINENFKVGMDVINYKFDNEDGNYYFVPPFVNNDPGVVLGSKPWIGYMARWDYYAELGYPEINTPDDYLNVIKQMQENHPKTAEGKKVYGFAAWSDWNVWPYHVPYMYNTGWLETGPLVFTPEGEITTRFSANGPYWEGVKFLNKANRMGLLDPDSFVMKYENMISKSKEGQILTMTADWMADECNAAISEREGKGKGFVYLPTNFAYSTAHKVSNSQAGYIGEYMWISKESNHVEEALKFMEYVHTYEGSRLIYSGIEGVHWDNSTGKPEWLDSTFEQFNTDSNFTTNTGVNLYSTMAGFDQYAKDPTDGAYMKLKNSIYALTKGASDLNKLVASKYGADFEGELWDKRLKEGETKFVSVDDTFIGNFGGKFPEDIKKIHDNIQEYLKKNYPKCILAESEKEFNEEMEKQMKDLKDLGIDQFLKWSQEEYQRAKSTAKELGVIK